MQALLDDACQHYDRGSARWWGYEDPCYCCASNPFAQWAGQQVGCLGCGLRHSTAVRAMVTAQRRIAAARLQRMRVADRVRGILGPRVLHLLCKLAVIDRTLSVYLEPDPAFEAITRVEVVTPVPNPPGDIGKLSNAMMQLCSDSDIAACTDPITGGRGTLLDLVGGLPHNYLMWLHPYNIARHAHTQVAASDADDKDLRTSANLQCAALTSDAEDVAWAKSIQARWIEHDAKRCDVAYWERRTAEQRLHIKLAVELTLRDLRHELQHFYMSHLVTKHLRAIKQRLWRPDGPLVQRRIRQERSASPPADAAPAQSAPAAVAGSAGCVAATSAAAASNDAGAGSVCAITAASARGASTGTAALDAAQRLPAAARPATSPPAQHDSAVRRSPRAMRSRPGALTAAAMLQHAQLGSKRTRAAIAGEGSP